MARAQDNLRTIIRLLSTGKHAQAKELAQATINSLENRRRLLERESDQVKREVVQFQGLLQEMQGVLVPARQPSLAPDPHVAKRVAENAEAADDNLTRAQILKVAEDLAHRTGDGTISVQGAEKAAVDAGLKLKPKARTQIGNVLYKSDKWQRIGVGVYKLKDRADIFN